MPGKTPGRERKSGGYQPIKSNSNVKQLSFKTNASGFGFESGTSAPKNNHVSFLPQATANIWTENRATFSDVVAQQPILPVGQGKMMKNSYMEQQKPMRRSAGDAQGMNVGGNMSNLGLGGGNMFNNNNNNNNKRNLMYGQRVKEEVPMYGSRDDSKVVNKRNSDDFGPIGTPLLTRNSPPFIQQNWEPMLGQATNIQQPTPMTHYYPNQNQGRSRFLDSFQNRNHLQQDNGNIGQQQQQQQDNNILEAANMMSQYPMWSADRNFLMEMFNRQQQQEQIDAWNRSTAWSPMNYTSTPATSNPVRPPPGLSLNRDRQQQQQQQHVGVMSAQQQHHQHSQQQQMQQQQGSHISNIRPEEVVASSVNTNVGGNVTGAAQGEPMRTYDPFKSLSYLWQGSTDLWGASNNNNKKQE